MKIPFAGVMVREITLLQNEIEKQKAEKVQREIREHSEDDCLQCSYCVLSNSDTLYLPYGLFNWKDTAKYIYTYLCHLYVYQFPKKEALIFINSITKTNFFKYENVEFIRWTFVYSGVNDILIIKICSII